LQDALNPALRELTQTVTGLMGKLGGWIKDNPRLARVLGLLALARRHGDQHRYCVVDRNVYSGVRAYWIDQAGARRNSVLVGTQDNAKRLRETYSSETHPYRQPIRATRCQPLPAARNHPEAAQAGAGGVEKRPQAVRVSGQTIPHVSALIVTHHDHHPLALAQGAFIGAAQGR